MSDCSEDFTAGEKMLTSCRSNNTSPVNFNLKSDASTSSGYFSSSSSVPSTPQSISPPHTLKRSRSSSFRLINRRISTVSNSSHISVPQESDDRLASFIGWYPAFLVRVFVELSSLFVFVIVKQLPFVLPTLWMSACLWLFWKCVLLPLCIVKGVLIFLFVPASERNRRKRTVLISGGSTVQALHLARNFFSAGARVVVCEVEGNFNLGRFSTAVHAVYTVPKPTDESVDAYIDSLKEIVAREEVKYYIPVSEANTAYYDAVAKPHLEGLGCECVCPDLRDVLLLDDTLELMRKVQGEGMSAPVYYMLQSNVDLKRLYEFDSVKSEPHRLVSVGLAGCKSRRTVDLKSPPNRSEHIKLARSINEQSPWLLIQEAKGDHYVTCTTVRDSQVVANVTCKMDSFRGLIPVEEPNVERWMSQFFASLKFNRKIAGHLSFHFTIVDGGTVIPKGCEVGVRLPYICYTSVQSRIVWKPCRHFSRHKSGPIVNNSGKYWLNEIVLNTLEYPSLNRINKLFEVILRSREALFVLWDPLPYCAYYYIQLPLNNMRSVFTKGKAVCNRL